MKRLPNTGRAVDRLTAIGTDHMACVLRPEAVNGNPLSSFLGVQRVMSRMIDWYSIICPVYSNFAPSHYSTLGPVASKGAEGASTYMHLYMRLDQIMLSYSQVSRSFPKQCFKKGLDEPLKFASCLIQGTLG